jgi:anti-sigma factor RsiW
VVDEGLMPADDYCAVGGLDAAGWVLGALDPGDAERFAQHLPSCRPCQRTVAELEPTGRMFRDTAPEPRPSSRLAATTMAKARQAAPQTRRSHRNAVDW